jgi:hypothetical protein
MKGDKEMIFMIVKYIIILSISFAPLFNDLMPSVHAEEIVSIPGDFNGDGDVDGSDLAVFASNFGRTDGTNLGSDWDFSVSQSLPHISNDMISFQNVIIENKRYMVTMKFDMSRFVPINREEINTVVIPFRTITIDGDDSDWAGILPVVVDPADDEHPDYSSVSGTDLQNVYIAHDDTYLYFRMTFHDGDPIEAQYVVEFQQFLYQLHTPGDISAYAQKEPGVDWIIFVNERSSCGTITTHSADYIGTGTGMIEWKVLIADMQYPQDVPFPYSSPVPVLPGIENQFVRGFIHPYPYLGVSDENDPLTRPIIVNFYD